MPGDEMPEEKDLLTEATLPFEERAKQRRYAQLSRFNIFLPPTGRVTLDGPDVKLLPRTIEGQYLLLLRIEASDDREGESDLSAIGAGPDVVHSGAVAGFPLPTLRYFVGAGSRPAIITLFRPTDNSSIPADVPVDFVWQENKAPQLVRLEIINAQDQEILSALLSPGVGFYRAPSWLRDRAAGGTLRWRVVTMEPDGQSGQVTPWRVLQLASGGVN
jgi:hypothetical protein